MHKAEIIKGNLLEASEQYIVHQCNCVTWNAAGIARSIFDKYPYADVYSIREATAYQDKPGTILIRGNGENERYIIALMGQVYPGKPIDNYKDIDSAELRQEYFKNGLQKIAELPELKSIALPVQIGCGLAGGNWNEYLDIINKFANDVYSNCKAETVLYYYDDGV